MTHLGVTYVSESHISLRLALHPALFELQAIWG